MRFGGRELIVPSLRRVLAIRSLISQATYHSRSPSPIRPTLIPFEDSKIQGLRDSWPEVQSRQGQGPGRWQAAMETCTVCSNGGIEGPRNPGHGSAAHHVNGTLG